MLTISGNLIREVHLSTIDIQSSTHSPKDPLFDTIAYWTLLQFLSDGKHHYFSHEREISFRKQQRTMQTKIDESAWLADFTNYLSMLRLFLAAVIKSANHLIGDLSRKNQALPISGLAKYTFPE